MSGRCPLCRAVGFRALGRYRQYSACKTIYLSHFPDQKRIRRVIGQEARQMLKAKQDPEILAVHRKRLADLEQVGLHQGLILDVGCGRGLFLDVARQKGYRAVGLDKARQLVGSIKRQGFPAVTAFSQLKGQRFDAVVAFDVIEHTPEPKQLLRQVLKHLKPGGLLMVTTPNAAGVSARLLNQHWWVLDPKRHYILFSPQSLKRSLTQLDLEIINLSSDTLTPWVMPSDTLSAKLLNKLVYLLLAPFRNLLFAKSLGDNLQVICRKPKRSAKRA